MSGPVVKPRTSSKLVDPSAAALSNGTDELTRKLLTAERAIASMALGVEGAVKLDPMLSESSEHLAFRKNGQKWQLVVETHHDDEVYTRHVPATSRDVRVKAALRVPELVELLRKVVSQEQHRVEVANQVLDSFLKTSGYEGCEEPGDDDIPF